MRMKEDGESSLKMVFSLHHGVSLLMTVSQCEIAYRLIQFQYLMTVLSMIIQPPFPEVRKSI